MSKERLLSDIYDTAASSVGLFLIVPAASFVGNWLQSFRQFPPRQKPGGFNLERVMEAVTEVAPISQ